jgi:integrase
MARGQKKNWKHLRLAGEKREKAVRVAPGIWLYPWGRYGVFVQRKDKQVFRMADTLTEARELRENLKKATRRGLRLVARATQKIRLQEFFTAVYEPEVMRGGGLKDSTIRSAQSRMRQHLEPFFRDDEIGSITYDDCMRFRAELMDRDDLSGQTQRECLLLLRQLLDEAVLRGILLANPAALVKLPKKKRVPVQVPEYEDAKKAIAQLHHPVARMLADLLLRTGMRLNEGLALEWRSVNLKAATIRVEQSIDQVTGKIVATKTEHVRIIDIPPSLVARLTAYRAAQEAGEIHRHDPWVFPAESTTEEGRPFNDRNFQQRHWNPAVARAEVEHFTPHALRHLFASHLLQRGVEISYVSKQLGHASIYTTHNFYAHFLPRSSSARQQLADSFAD